WHWVILGDEKRKFTFLAPLPMSRKDSVQPWLQNGSTETLTQVDINFRKSTTSMATMHRLNFASKGIFSHPILPNSASCLRNIQRRHKHGRDYPRNLPPPPRPSRPLT